MEDTIWRCLLCDSETAFSYTENDYALWRCSVCQLVFVAPKPSPREIEKFYQQEAGHTFHHSADISASYEKTLEAQYRFRFIEPFLRAHSVRRILEIGCGAGYGLRTLRQRGYEVEGLELASCYVSFARAHLGIPIQYGTIHDYHPSVPPQAVLMLEVLSHCYNPVVDLKAIGQALAPKGLLILETGNNGERQPQPTESWGVPEHLYFFSERSIERLLILTGFRLLKLYRFDVSWQRGLLEYIGKVKKRSGNSLPHFEPQNVLPSSWPESNSPTTFRKGVKNLYSTLLLGLRYKWGRAWRRRDRPCSFLVIARKMG